MTDIDTTTDAVERLIVTLQGKRCLHPPTGCRTEACYCDAIAAAEATLRAIAAERDALQLKLDMVLNETGEARRDR